MREDAKDLDNTSDFDNEPDSRATRINLFTVPNLLCAIRLIGSPLLVLLAWAEMTRWCLILFGFLLATDWVDGKLARWLKQKTTFGARLDSLADITFYGCALWAGCWLKWSVVRQEMIWVGAAIGAFLLNLAVGWIKFHRPPGYHTRLAKTLWLLSGVAFVAVVADWSVWPLRVAMAAAVLTNLEETAITIALPRWEVNVPSLYHAMRACRRAGEAGPAGRKT